MGKNKITMTVNFSEKQREKLIEMARKAGHRTAQDAVRHAVRVLDNLLEVRERGGKLYLEVDEEREEFVLGEGE